MFRTYAILLTMAGAITLGPSLSHDSPVVRADDWEDYWDDYEDAREDYYDDLRDRQRRYWRRHRQYDRLSSVSTVRRIAITGLELPFVSDGSVSITGDDHPLIENGATLCGTD